jgi:hypothetical protein
MFLVAAILYLVAASFAWALPPEKANSSAQSFSRHDYEDLLDGDVVVSEGGQHSIDDRPLL